MQQTPQSGNVTSGPSKGANALQRLQESYLRRLDERIDQLTENYGNILHSAKVRLNRMQSVVESLLDSQRF